MKQKTKILVLSNKEVFKELAILLQDDFEFIHSDEENIVVENNNEKEITKILAGFQNQEFDFINKINKKTVDFSSHKNNSSEMKLFNKTNEQNYKNKYKVKPKR